MSSSEPEPPIVNGQMATSSNPPDGGKRKKRLRPVVVCTHCRRRKIKCDKQSPCSNCVKINMASSCVYDTHLDKKPGDEYRMEIQLPLNNPPPRNPQTGSNQGYVGSFMLDNARPRSVKKQRKSNSPPPTAQGPSNGHQGFSAPQNATAPPSAPFSSAQVNKSELELLKDRLQQIERSLLGSAPRASPGSANSASPSNAVAGALSNGVEKPQMPPIPSTFPPVSRPEAYGQFGQSQVPNGIGAVNGNPNMSVPQSMLPPLNSSFRYDEETSPSGTKPKPKPVSRVSTSDSTISPHSSVSSGMGNGNGSSSTDISSSNSVTTDSPKSLFPHAEDFLIGTNIYNHPNDTINFYEKYSSVHYKDPLRRINYGPFAWSSLMKRDIGLRLVWDHIVEQKDKNTAKEENAALVFARQSTEINQETTNTILSADKFADHHEKQFQKRALQTDGYDESIPYNSILKARQERNIQKQILNRTTLPLGLTFYDGQIDRELQLIEKIQVVLPKKRVVWKLIYRYFTWVYTYMPFLDEQYFRRDVARIIGPQSLEDEPITDLKIERKLDLAVVGILLIVLRLAYLSLFSNNSTLNEQILNSNDPSPEIQGSKYLMRNPININTIDVAQLCLDQFQVFRKTNFTVMQLTLYLRLYHTYAPEDGDGADGGDSQVLNAVLIQMAYSLGLNREPDEQCKDLKINNLSRKIWNYLMMSDTFLGYTFGNPMSTDDIYYDTKPPFCVAGGENIIDKDRDRLITDRYNNCTFLSPLLRDLTRLTLNMKSRIPLPLLCAKLSKLEVEWHTRCGTLKDCITCNGKGESFTVERNLKVKIYLAYKAFLLSIYFHLYLYYESKTSDVAFFYMKKCLLITTADIMPHYSALLGRSEVISDMIINPTLEVVVHKANMVYMSAIVRTNFTIFHLRQNSEHARLCKEDKSYLTYFQLLCQVSSCLTRAAEYTISAISKISNRYYYAWRITKGQTFLLKIITSTQFYEENYHNASMLYSSRYKSEQVEELIKICEATLTKYRHSEFCTYGFSKQADKQLFQCNYSPAESVRSEGSNASTSSSNPADRLNNSEVDKLWLQVLSMKHDQSLAANYPDAPVDAKTPGGPATAGPNENYVESPRPSVVGNFDINTPGGAPTNLDQLGYDIEMANKFDMFSDMPFDQMFNL